MFLAVIFVELTMNVFYIMSCLRIINILLARAVLVSLNSGCFSPSRCSHFHCNAMRKSIKAHKNLHTNQQNEHTPAVLFYVAIINVATI